MSSNFLFSLLFPRKCLGCGQWGSYFCSHCLNRISLADQKICPVCEKPAIHGLTHARCQTAQSLDGLTTIFSYQGLTEKAIKKIKYKFISDLAQDLVEAFLSFCGEDQAFSRFCQKEKPVFLSIPLHPRRKRWRGFNQTELLGKMIASNLGLIFEPNLLIRTKNTKPQTQLKDQERKKNVLGVFKINKNLSFLIRASRFVIFDDVWTTGSTLKEGAKTLKRAGAKKVWGLTLAR